jgi:membrane associated rhomboid family serine protease
MFIPLKDENPRILIPYVTWSILAVNILVFVLQKVFAGSDPYFFMKYGATPFLITGGDLPVGLPYSPIIPFLSIFTSIFIHGGYYHLASNMLFLYVFADNVESILGHKKFLIYYLLCGVAATFAQALIDVESTIPLIGASGAISGMMAGYLVKYPKAKILTLVFIFPIMLPAFVVVGFWFGSQVLNGMANLNQTGGGVAWFAHIGGFVAGLVLMFLISKGKFNWRT